MIITNDSTTVEGDLLFDEEVEMKIDQASIALIIEGLTKMYSNPYIAALREYTSNAYDSHVEAGQTRPVEVSLPSSLSAQLVIQDWGVGMSRARLRQFAQYGYSDKRESNEFTGGFGLGSKSALAFCTQFTVVAVKDGKRNTVVMGRKQAGGPAMGLMEEEDTDQPDGVTILIPTNERHKFEDAMEHGLFLGWPKGSIKVNGHEPEVSVHDTEMFSDLNGDGWLLTPKFENIPLRTDTYKGRAVVNQVEYSLDWSVVNTGSHSVRSEFLRKVVVKLDNGMVSLPNNRENIIYDSPTRKHIQEKVQRIIDQGEKTYRDQIEAAPDRRAALLAVQAAKSSGFPGPYMYRGEKAEHPTLGTDIRYAFTRGYTYSYNGGSRFSTNLSPSPYNKFGPYHATEILRNAKTIILVTGATKPIALDATPGQPVETRHTQHAEARKVSSVIRALADKEGKGVTQYILYYTHLTEAELGPWVLDTFERQMKVADAEALGKEYRSAQAKAAREANKALPKPSATLVRQLHMRNSVGYDIEIEMDDLPADKPFILLKGGESKIIDAARRTMMTQIGRRERRKFGQVLDAIYKDHYFLIANKTAKTDHYAASINLVSLEDAIKKTAEFSDPKYTPMQQVAIQDRSTNRHYWARHFDKSKIELIKNPATREWLTAMTDNYTGEEAADFFELTKEAISEFDLKLDETERAAPVPLPKSPGTGYGLLSNSSYPNEEDAIEYINLLDAHRNKTKTA